MDPFWNQFFPDSSNPPDETSLQGWNQAPSIYQQNHPGASSGITLNQTNGSTVQASQSPNTASSARVLKKSQSSLSVPDRNERKRQIDKDYRERVKNNKMQMQLDFLNLTRENDSLKEENQSLKEDNASINQTLTKQAAMIDELRGDLLQLKRDHDKQDVLLETLTQYLADPLRIENETLKAENASLRKSANLNGNVPQLLEEIAKLKLENKLSDSIRRVGLVIKLSFHFSVAAAWLVATESLHQLWSLNDFAFNAYLSLCYFESSNPIDVSVGKDQCSF
ncbi:hypothetical protein V6N13_000359 [Hibiscus sabdariffa]|uniref:BZIP domain-containing protein n=1 Tax=Hibiscus sabdariffa TaxID=183260 RepID=A0ABR2G514_9ROSI